MMNALYAVPWTSPNGAVHGTDEVAARDHQEAARVVEEHRPGYLVRTADLLGDLPADHPAKHGRWAWLRQQARMPLRTQQLAAAAAAMGDLPVGSYDHGEDDAADDRLTDLRATVAAGEDVLGQCDECHCVRWLATVSSLDVGFPRGSCRSCAREAS
jgi:hypothetical protein